MKQKLVNLKTYILERRVSLFILLLAATYFVFMYVTDPTRPRATNGGGWLSYFDQSAYLKQAAAMKAGHLRDYFVYAPLYPLLAVPFMFLGFYVNSLFFFNLFSFVFVTWAVYKYTSSTTSDKMGVVAAMALVFATPLVHYTVVPWNSTVCLLAVGIILYVASKQRNYISAVDIFLLSLAGGMAFASRYVDVVWVSGATVALIVSRGIGLKKIVLLGSVTLVMALPVLWAHQVIFGSPLRTPYILHTSINGGNTTDQDLGAYSLRRIPNAAYGMLVSPMLAGSTDANRGLLAGAFWFLGVLTFPFIKRIDQRNKLFLMALLAITVVHSLFYLSFRASGPDAVKFGTLHYFKMFWPVLTILSALSFDSIFNVVVRPPSHKNAEKVVYKKRTNGTAS